ncbi:MAG: carbohydrate-binding domain-containing protein, partial [Planctomycetota bacterium]
VRLPATSWGGVGRDGDHLAFNSNATANARWVARRAGRYRVSLELGGSKAVGGYPVARVVCDARNLGEVALDGAAFKTYELEVTVPAGPHNLAVIFTNDAYEPPEDRNMKLRGAVLRLVPPRIY